MKKTINENNVKNSAVERAERLKKEEGSSIKIELMATLGIILSVIELVISIFQAQVISCVSYGVFFVMFVVILVLSAGKLLRANK